MNARKFRVSYTIDVEVIVNDADVFDRITGPSGDEWRAEFYGMRTERDVVDHFAFNAIANRVCQANELDGWADLGENAATMTIDRDNSGVVDEIVELGK